MTTNKFRSLKNYLVDEHGALGKVTFLNYEKYHSINKGNKQKIQAMNGLIGKFQKN